MTQINLTLEPEFLKSLFMNNDGEAVRKLVEKVINALLNAETVEQAGVGLYEDTNFLDTTLPQLPVP